MNLRYVCFTAAAIFFINGCADNPAGSAYPEVKTIARIIRENPELSTLDTIIKATGLFSHIDEEGPYTFFAPSNSAFSAMNPDTLRSFLEDPQSSLTTVLLYHLLWGSLTSSEISQNSTLSTLQGSSIDVSFKNDTLFLDEEAAVTISDIKASNGIIHIINTVLDP